jgi:hypothetical protein
MEVASEATLHPEQCVGVCWVSGEQGQREGDPPTGRSSHLNRRSWRTRITHPAGVSVLEKLLWKQFVLRINVTDIHHMAVPPLLGAHSTTLLAHAHQEVGTQMFRAVAFITAPI